MGGDTRLRGVDDVSRFLEVEGSSTLTGDFIAGVFVSFFFGYFSASLGSTSDGVYASTCSYPRAVVGLAQFLNPLYKIYNLYKMNCNLRLKVIFPCFLTAPLLLLLFLL